VSERGNQPSGRRRRNRSRGPKKVDLWRPVPELDPPDPIFEIDDDAVRAMVLSLGDPPLYGQSGGAGHYFAAVAAKASDLAVALAAAAGLLDDGSEAEPSAGDADEPGTSTGDGSSDPA